MDKTDRSLELAGICLFSDRSVYSQLRLYFRLLKNVAFSGNIGYFYNNGFSNR
jgi:hypothetical protein